MKDGYQDALVANGGPASKKYPTTPDGRYFVVGGRLWRNSDPALDPVRRHELVNELMSARRAVRAAKDETARKAEARVRVDTAKRFLGGRGPVWWSDGSPDYDRTMVSRSPYAEWYESRNRT